MLRRFRLSPRGVRHDAHQLPGRGGGRGKAAMTAVSSSCLIGAGLLGLAQLMPQPAAAVTGSSAAAFFQGKTLTVTVPYGAAGGYEYWAAALKPYLQKALGAARIDIVNKPGGGGLIGENYLYASKPDGLTIGEVNGGGSIFDQIVHKPGVNFDMTKFAWLGSPDVETTLTAARAGSYKSFADLYKLHGGSTKAVVLSAGYGGEDYVGAVLPLATFGIPYTVLLAYQGSSAAKAGLLRGDGDLANYGYSVFKPLINAHEVVPLYLTAPQESKLLPGVPTILELAQQRHLPQASIDTLRILSHAMTMGKDWAAPPGVPADRLAFLRAAFKTATEDPGFLAAAAKAGRVGGYTPPQAIEQTNTDVINAKTTFAPFLK